MDAALGPPEKMAGQAGELTPMMSQYHDLCAQYEDSLVLFQVGDFYETFCEAAETTARLCEITLTKREDSTGTYPMAGVPIDNAESYIETLLDAGYRVAVADQVQDPEETTGVVDRAVTRIVTPGTLTEAELLDGDDNNFVACLTADRPADERADPGADDHGATRYGLALLDVSTGDFYATSVDSPEAAGDEVGRFAPAEAIVGPEVGAAASDVFGADCMVTPYERRAFDAERAREKLDDYFGAPEALLAADVEVRACGALLAYGEYTRGGEAGRLDYLNHLTRYDPQEYMLLDAVALRSLELFERRSVHGAEGAALVDVVDETACALGSRELTDWLRRPLVDREAIEARHEAVAELVSDVATRERLHERLHGVYDVERLVTRVSRGRANARDLRSLHDTLAVVPELREALADAGAPKLRDLHGRMDPCGDVRDLIDRAVVAEPPIEVTEGGVIREGYDDALDELRETERSGKAWVDDLQARERERTGIDSLKVGKNQVHGYYIEVTDPNLDRVPDDYHRRQTLKNSERYYTPELKEREDEILRAESRADDLEYDLFADVRSRVADEAERVQALAEAVAELDALVSLATVAAERDYARPEIVDEDIHVERGRHPVVERSETAFVPNDADLTREERFAVVTGPNMSGKSTYMRQVALVCILAQMGSFVPAESARVQVLDRVFTRVGASDDIAGGRSTFMVEMTELADILRDATPDSLVLLDEVGRGTSTADGLAIARAVTEYLHDEVAAYTLFATHHHDLTATADRLPHAFNLHFAADEVGEEVQFRHDVARGAATASYGVEVAGTAGVPDPVVERANELLDGEAVGDGEASVRSGTGDGEGEGGNGHHPDAVIDDRPEPPPDLVEELDSVDVGSTTPLEALNKLAELKRLVEEEEEEEE